MMRPKAENLIIAVGLAILYIVTPNLSYQVRQSFSKPLTKQHLNEEITKYDPETDLMVEMASLRPFQELPPSFKEVPPPFESKPVQQFAYLPYISTAGGTPAAAIKEPEVPPEVPVRLEIPLIGLNAPIVPAKTKVININGEKYRQWLVPRQYAAGWHKNSARLGEIGNTVLNGHHNVHGEVFARLVDLKEGDFILIHSENRVYPYIITNKMILPERYEDLDIRMNNAQWILPSDDERVTLITCWPYESNTHRLIIVAKPSPAPAELSALDE